MRGSEPGRSPDALCWYLNDDARKLLAAVAHETFFDLCRRRALPRRARHSVNPDGFESPVRLARAQQAAATKIHARRIRTRVPQGSAAVTPFAPRSDV
jgi:hypothetical protein